MINIETIEPSRNMIRPAKKYLISTLQAPFVDSTKTSFTQKTISSKILCCRCQFTKCKCMCSNVIRPSIPRAFLFSVDWVNFRFFFKNKWKKRRNKILRKLLTNAWIILVKSKRDLDVVTKGKQSITKIKSLQGKTENKKKTKQVR